MSGEQNTQQLNEQLSDDLQASVEKTFLQMFGKTVKASFKVVESDQYPASDVSSIIMLSQKEPHGALVVSFPQATLFALLKGFYKKDFTELDKVAMGSVGEISNIIFGVLKYRLQGKGFSFGMALPQVVAGGGHRVANAEWTLCGEFLTEDGPLSVLLIRVQTPKSA